MNQDMSWNDTSISYNPLGLLHLIDKWCFHSQSISIRLQPNKTSNLPSTPFTKFQWPIHSSMSVSTQRLISPSPLEWPKNIKHFWNMCHKRNIFLFSIMHGRASSIHAHRLWRLITSWRAIKTERKPEQKLKLNTQNEFYPKSCPQNPHLLKKYNKIAVPKIPVYEGLSFAQVDSNKCNWGRGGWNMRGGGVKSYNKKYCKYK